VRSALVLPALPLPSLRISTPPRSLPTTEQSIRRQRIARTLVYSFLVAVAIVYIFPFVIAVVTAFKTEPNATADPLSLVPSPATTTAFHQLYKDQDFLLWVKNSMIVTLSVTFLRVFLPLSLPGVLAGCTMVFVLCLGFYITPELLGGGRTVMVSMLVSRNVELYNQFGAASAVAVVLLLSVLAIFFVVSRFISLDRILGQK